MEENGSMVPVMRGPSTYNRDTETNNKSQNLLSKSGVGLIGELEGRKGSEHPDSVSVADSRGHHGITDIYRRME
jgi:hypothetical protein